VVQDNAATTMNNTENIRDLPKEGSTPMFKLTLRYVRYALSALVTIGFLGGSN
jgi:hypothetical protein